MKLLVCKKCNDIFNLRMEMKTCGCGETSGRYVDQLNAEISGMCQPIGFNNYTVKKAMRMQQMEDSAQELARRETCCRGNEFEAFFIPASASSIKRVESPNVIDAKIKEGVLDIVLELHRNELALLRRISSSIYDNLDAEGGYIYNMKFNSKSCGEMDVSFMMDSTPWYREDFSINDIVFKVKALGRVHGCFYPFKYDSSLSLKANEN